MKRFIQIIVVLILLTLGCPNLNLIERLWKFIKKEWLYSEYYDKFPDFKQAIINSITHPDKEKLASLLTLNFQPFNSVTLSPC
jgi:hypothetical protein